MQLAAEDFSAIEVFYILLLLVICNDCSVLLSHHDLISMSQIASNSILNLANMSSRSGLKLGS